MPCVQKTANPVSLLLPSDKMCPVDLTSSGLNRYRHFSFSVMEARRNLKLAKNHNNAHNKK